MTDLAILYRGPLASCNYSCTYCPFAKRRDTAAQLQHDRQCLERFTAWIEQQTDHCWGILFTPWGETLTRRWYRQAMEHLSHLPHIRKVAVQTNLSCSVDWLQRCRVDRLGIWATFHPTEVALDRFAAKVHQVRQLGVSLSVGVVGVPEHREQIAQLRAAIPPDVYVWINAQGRRTRKYLGEEVAFFQAIDPLFELNLKRHRSGGRACRTGETVFTVDGTGAMRRCHFIDTVIGNIYRVDWLEALRPRPCERAFCKCHIGYVHLEHLQLDRVFGNGILERSITPEQFASLYDTASGTDTA